LQTGGNNDKHIGNYKHCLDSKAISNLNGFEHNKTTKNCNDRQTRHNTAGRDHDLQVISPASQSYVDIATVVPTFVADGDPGPVSPTDNDST